uniref:Uncharacterized protein n=1 Tax=Hucho hucho TaxID=62062 RepID=A0A4W5R601_9TELE
MALPITAGCDTAWNRTRVCSDASSTEMQYLRLQIYEAYRNGKVEEAMSFGFLLFLFSGDLSSLVGCVLTSQLPIQIVTVVFYIFTDLLLISQFLYYKIKNNSSKSKASQIVLHCPPNMETH